MLDTRRDEAPACQTWLCVGCVCHKWIYEHENFPQHVRLTETTRSENQRTTPQESGDGHHTRKSKKVTKQNSRPLVLHEETPHRLHVVTLIIRITPDFEISHMNACGWADLKLSYSLESGNDRDAKKLMGLEFAAFPLCTGHSKEIRDNWFPEHAIQSFPFFPTRSSAKSSTEQSAHVYSEEPAHYTNHFFVLVSADLCPRFCGVAVPLASISCPRALPRTRASLSIAIGYRELCACRQKPTELTRRSLIALPPPP